MEFGKICLTAAALQAALFAGCGQQKSSEKSSDGATYQLTIVLPSTVTPSLGLAETTATITPYTDLDSNADTLTAGDPVNSDVQDISGVKVVKYDAPVNQTLVVTTSDGAEAVIPAPGEAPAGEVQVPADYSAVAAAFRAMPFRNFDPSTVDAILGGVSKDDFVSADFAELIKETAKQIGEIPKDQRQAMIRQTMANGTNYIAMVTEGLGENMGAMHAATMADTRNKYLDAHPELAATSGGRLMKNPADRLTDDSALSAKIPPARAAEVMARAMEVQTLNRKVASDGKIPNSSEIASVREAGESIRAAVLAAGSDPTVMADLITGIRTAVASAGGSGMTAEQMTSMINGQVSEHGIDTTQFNNFRTAAGQHPMGPPPERSSSRDSGN